MEALEVLSALGARRLSILVSSIYARVRLHAILNPLTAYAALTVERQHRPAPSCLIGRYEPWTELPVRPSRGVRRDEAMAPALLIVSQYSSPSYRSESSRREGKVPLEITGTSKTRVAGAVERELKALLRPPTHLLRLCTISFASSRSRKLFIPFDQLSGNHCVVSSSEEPKHIQDLLRTSCTHFNYSIISFCVNDGIYFVTHRILSGTLRRGRLSNT